MYKFAMLAATAAIAFTALAAPVLAQPNENYRKSQHGNEQSSDFECGAQFGFLKRVLPAQVAGIDDDYRVWVTPVCLGEELLRAEGNADYLRPTIARNKVLVKALFDKNYRPDAVFAVKMMGDETIVLYVHDFAN